MRRRWPVVVVTLGVLALAGCGGHDEKGSGATHVMPDGTVMSGSAMPGESTAPSPTSSAMTAQDAGDDAQPSETASMVCGDEIRGDVQHVLQLDQAPVGVHSWSDRLFRCTYQLGSGTLTLSVKDLDSAKPGRAYFDSLQRRLPEATPVAGLANYGLPAFETKRGDTVFLKDDKTLWVDASRLGASDVPSGSSRSAVSYAVAADVVACWSE